MPNKKASAGLKLVKKTPSSHSPEKSKDKVVFCKALECTQKAQTKGLCRLHYIKSLAKGKTGPASSEPRSATDKNPDQRWGSRVFFERASGFESHLDDDISQVVEDRLHQLGSLDGDFTSLLSDDEIDPFKKAS